jgi:hypothetical protein
MPEQESTGYAQHSEEEENRAACTMFDEQSRIARTSYRKIATNVRSIGNQAKTGKEAEKVCRSPSKSTGKQPEKQGQHRSENGTSTIDEERIVDITGICP